MTLKKLLFSLFILFSAMTFGQSNNFRFKKQLEKDPLTPIAFAIKNTNGQLSKLLKEKDVHIKQITREWIYVQTSPAWINSAQKDGSIEQFYFEFSIPTALNDTSLLNQNVVPVHQGLGGLTQAYKGQNVIIGYVDQGIDLAHPDFIDANGNSRVLYYWDHSVAVPSQAPQPYNYGQVWYPNQIQNGTCTSTEESTAHGTTVAGAGSSNGRATGRETGMAPESNIIVVESNFNLPNWTLTIADACDFIFQKADSLGMPAIVNLSLGSYLGSHDGDDPAANLIESLLDAKPGRLVVSAAGNSGNWGKYHVGGTMNPLTPKFVWMLNNPSSQIAANSIYMDMWTDLTDATWQYALAANLPSGTFEERGTTSYRPATFSAGTPIYDTIWNGSNRLATVEIYPEIVGTTMHIEYFISHVDSTSYYFALKTQGTGKFDAWTGSASLALNDMVTNIPTIAQYPAIANYFMPDSLQTIVSSWNCSEKVVTVGNYRNRYSHIDNNGNTYLPAPSYTAVVGQLSPNSSKGPSRKGDVKPNIAASGDVALSAAPLWFLANTGYNASISDDGMHARNGGTSMASPVIAGIAALYFQKCPTKTYQDFINDLQNSAFTDGFTGAAPNFAYGYGKCNALDLLLEQTTCSGLGINELEESFFVYPNPSNDHISILGATEIDEIRVYDLQGKLVIGSTKNTDHIAVNHLKAGTYLIQIENTSGSHVVKFIKN